MILVGLPFRDLPPDLDAMPRSVWTFDCPLKPGEASEGARIHGRFGTRRRHGDHGTDRSISATPGHLLALPFSTMRRSTTTRGKPLWKHIVKIVNRIFSQNHCDCAMLPKNGLRRALAAGAAHAGKTASHELPRRRKALGVTLRAVRPGNVLELTPRNQ